MADKDIKILIETILKDKKFKEGLEGMRNGLKKTQGVGAKAFGALKTAMIGLAGIQGLRMLVNGFKAAVKIAAEFEQAIANVASVSGGSRKELEKMALTIDKRLGFTSKQAADAMYFLASAGLAVKDMSKVLEPTLRLAAAAQMEIAAATDLVVNNLKVYGGDMSKAAMFTDVMAKTVASTNTNMQQLGLALSMSASSAKQAGVSFEDINAIIGTLANQGIKGSRAGRQLRMALVRLIKPTSEGQAVLEKYGLSTEKVSEMLSKPGGLIKLFKRLRDAGLSQKDALGLLGVRQANIFGLIKDGVPDLEMMQIALENAGGAAQKMAEVQLDTLQGSLKELNAEWEDYTLLLQSKNMPILQNIVKIFTSLVKILQESVFGLRHVINIFDSWWQKIKTVAAAIKALVTLNRSQWKYVFSDTKSQLDAIGKLYEKNKKKIISEFKGTRGANKKNQEDITEDTTDELEDRGNKHKKIVKKTAEEIKKEWKKAHDEIMREWGELYFAVSGEVSKVALATGTELGKVISEMAKFADEATALIIKIVSSGGGDIVSLIKLVGTVTKGVVNLVKSFTKESEKENKIATDNMLFDLGRVQSFIIEQEIEALERAKTNALAKMEVEHDYTKFLAQQEKERYDAMSQAEKDEYDLKKQYDADIAALAASHDAGIRDARIRQFNIEKDMALIELEIDKAEALSALKKEYPFPWQKSKLKEAWNETTGLYDELRYLISSQVPSFQGGTERVGFTGKADLHEGERVIPSNMNIPAISNADFVGAAMRGLSLGGMPGGGTTNNSSSKTNSFAGAVFNLTTPNPQNFMTQLEELAQDTNSKILTR